MKKKISEIIKQFYGSRTDTYNNCKVKFRLTSHSDEPNESDASPDIGPHDLILTSVNIYKFQFEKIFSESKHNVMDVVN